MPDIILATPDREEIRRPFAPHLVEAHDLAVRDKTTHTKALQLDRVLAEDERIVKGKLDPIIQQAHKTHKALTTLRVETLSPIWQARGVLARKIADFSREAELEAERRRAEAEVAARRAAEEQVLAKAEAAFKAGDAQKADAILSAPIRVPSVNVEPEVGKVEGAFVRKTWSAEVDDRRALIAFVAANPDQWGHLIEPCMEALNDLARRQKEGLSIPGVRPVYKESVVQRNVGVA